MVNRETDLVREPVALEDARRRARAIAAKSRELAEERGILTCFLAVGMATWAAHLQSIQQLGARLARLTTEVEIGTAIPFENLAGLDRPSLTAEMRRATYALAGQPLPR